MREPGAYMHCDKRKLRERMQARLADGNTIDVASERVNLQLSFLDFDSQELLYVIDMNYRYDIILGMPWLKSQEPWVNWRTGEIGSSHSPSEVVVGSWRDQHLYLLEEGQTRALDQPGTDAPQGEESCPHSRAVDETQGLSPIQPSDQISGTAEERDDDMLTDVQRKDHSVKKKSRSLSFADDHEQPLGQIVLIPREGKGLRVPPLGGNTVPGTAKRYRRLLKGRLHRQGVVLKQRPSARAVALPDAVCDLKQNHRLVGFDPGEVEDLAKDAKGLLALERLPYKTFLRSLRKGTITDVAFICVEQKLELSAVAATTGKQERFNSQNWEEVKNNPSYPVLRKYKEVFEEAPSRLPVDKGIRHEIDLEPGTKYCVTRQWPLPKEQVEAIDAHFAKAYAAGRVRESKSPHSAPTFCVKKATGGWRIVHAYNKLNAATIPAQTPIPRRDAIIDSMGGSERFSAIDLTDGYYQLLMRDGDIPYTACSTPSGMLWEWLVMPQGLKNAPATFNRLVTHLFRPMRDFVQTYFDDIFIHSRPRDGLSAIEAHNEDLAKVLQCMKDNHLYANLKKCVFNVPEIPVLGCYVGVDGVRVDPDKVKAVADWPEPRNLKDLRKWLGLANYLHRFSKNYAELARPLTSLLKKDVAFKWTATHTSAFKAIKQSLSEAPILALPDFDTPFWVVCDASDFAIGCALLQHDADGKERVVSYQSRALKAAEKNYPVHDKELLAMKYALVKFRVYLLGSKPFVIYTDHASLRTATQSPHLSQRMARWLSFFAEYNFTVAYKPGRENILADALSRRPDYDPKEIDHLMGISVVKSDIYDEIRAAYADDEQCLSLIKHLTAEPNFQSELSEKLRASQHRYSYRDQLLYYRVHEDDTPRIVVPNDDIIREKLIYEFHDTPMSGHIGREKTYAALSERYYWRRMYKHVQRYVRSCAICQTVKSAPSNAAPLHSLPVPSECWTDVGLDYIFGFPTDRHRRNGILVFVDRLSKMVHLIPCSKNIDAKQSAHHFINHVFKHHGMPDRLVSDRDPRFTGTFWKEVFQRLGTKLNMSTASHPESDGQTERANRVLEDMLRSFCAKFPSEWSSLLPLVEFAINNAVHASTGYTPFYVNHLRNPRVPATLSTNDESGVAAESDSLPAVDDFLTTRRAVLRFIRDNMADAQDKQKQAADRHGRRQIAKFAKGELVLLSTRELPADAMSKHMQHTTTKLYPRFIGPFKVIDQAGTNAYRLDLPSHFSRVHPVFYVGLLKAFVDKPHLDQGMDRVVKDSPPPNPLPESSVSAQTSNALPSGPPPLSRMPPAAPLAGRADSLPAPELQGSHPSRLGASSRERPNSQTCSSSTPPIVPRPPVRTRAGFREPSRDPLTNLHDSQPQQGECDPQQDEFPTQSPYAAQSAHPCDSPSLDSEVQSTLDEHCLPERSNQLSVTRSPRRSSPACPTDLACSSDAVPSHGESGAPSRTEQPTVVVDGLPIDQLSAESRHRRYPNDPSMPSGHSLGSERVRAAVRANQRENARRPYSRIPVRTSPQRDHPPQSTEQYTVQRLVLRRCRRGAVQYLVHWLGYPNSQRTWEPRTHLLEDCPLLVHAYEAAHPLDQD